MKTWEMIKKISENPEKKFKSFDFGQVEMHSGCLVDSEFMECILVDSDFFRAEWEEVKEPIPFMELIEKIKTIPSATFEHLNGTKFRVEHGLIDATSHKGNLWNLSEFVEILGMEFTDMQVRKILLEGKFYIED